jgi:transposase
MARTLTDVEAALGADKFRARVAQAEAEAALLDRVLERALQGVSRSAAIRELLPGKPVESMLRRLRKYEEGGRDALVSHRYGPPAELKMTEQVKGGLRALALTDATAGSAILAERLSALFDISVSPSLVQEALQELGLARPRGRPWWRAAGATAPTAEPEAVVQQLAVAGAELLKAVDEDCGAVAALTKAIGAQLAALPVVEGPVEDDRADRDGRGRFLGSYNEPQQRLEPELGDKFNSVAARRAVKDLPAMRVVAESDEVRHRKNLGLVLLPVIVRGSRWSELGHWRGDHLEDLVGYAYQASTIDKYLRELKLAGSADAAREAMATFWLEREGTPTDTATGAVVVYADTATKPLWTHHWTRATRVSKTGRVMPATSMLTLHSGAGTPLVFRNFCGNVSLAGEIEATLAMYERHAGEGAAQRIVVMDREAHAVWLFKLLDSKKWGFVVPLRANVLGPKARFEEQGPWAPYGADGDEVCDAWLWLNDTRPGEPEMRVRVLGRRRHRTGKVAWFATNRPPTELPAEAGIRLYFDRWPAQEHVYRDGTGAVGLEVHHGYGKRKVENIVVIDRLERLEGQIRKREAEVQKYATRAVDLRHELQPLREVLGHATPLIQQDRVNLEAAIGRRGARAALQERFHSLGLWENWLADSNGKAERLEQQIRQADQDGAAATADIAKKRLEIERLMGRRQIFTVDVELDEIMTAYKLTFMNLCRVLMDEHLDLALEIETLVDAVLTLPGERILQPTVETVRIYRQPRDERIMSAVERACASLTRRGLRRGDRTLRFEVVPRPARIRAADPNDL